MKRSDSGDRQKASMILYSRGEEGAESMNTVQTRQAKFLCSLGAEKSAMFYSTVTDANSLDKENGNHNKAEQRMQM